MRAPARSAFSVALRTARGDESIRSLAARVGISKSALGRYESGSAVPSGNVLSRIDAALDQQGALLTIADSDATTSGEDGTTFSWHLYEADWVGPVWVRIRPAGTPGRRTLMLDWGPWSRRIDCEIDEVGIVLTVGLTRRPGVVPLPISLRSNEQVHVHWSRGVPVGFGNVLDVTDGWELSDPEELVDASGAMIREALAVRGRSPAEFAEFLGVDEATIERWLSGGDVGALRVVR
jgi:transcriptional regulator with XRE-family HTH domain